MSNSKKIAITVAIVLVGIGIIVSFCSLAAMNFDYTALAINNTTRNEYGITKPFSDISVKAAEARISLIPSKDGSCKVICTENSNVTHSVYVSGDELRIERIDARKWYQYVGIYLGEQSIEIYLPESEYNSLYLLSLSGDIVIPSGFAFTGADIHNTSGDVSISAKVEKELSVRTVSGDITLNGADADLLRLGTSSGDISVSKLNVKSECSVSTVSGDISFDKSECGSIEADTTSGEVNLKATKTSGNIDVVSVSGDVRLTDSDCRDLAVRTTSGNVSGNLLTEKFYSTSTVSGDVNVPQTRGGGSCEVRTVSGDVTFR